MVGVTACALRGRPIRVKVSLATCPRRGVGTRTPTQPVAVRPRRIGWRRIRSSAVTARGIASEASRSGETPLVGSDGAVEPGRSEPARHRAIRIRDAHPVRRIVCPQRVPAERSAESRESEMVEEQVVQKQPVRQPAQSPAPAAEAEESRKQAAQEHTPCRKPKPNPTDGYHSGGYAPHAGGPHTYSGLYCGTYTICGLVG